MTDHDVRIWLKDKDEDLFNRVRAKCAGKDEEMIPTIISILNDWAIRE